MSRKKEIADKRLLIAIAELAGYEDVICIDDPDNPGRYILVSRNLVDQVETEENCWLVWEEL